MMMEEDDEEFVSLNLYVLGKHDMKESVLVGDSCMNRIEIRDKEVLWTQGHGNVVIQRFAFSTEVIDVCIASFTDGKQPSVLCILYNAEAIKVYAEDGASYDVALPFRASRLLAMPKGILIQREAEEDYSTTSIPQSQPRPVLFSLSSPLDDIKPMAKAGDSNEFFSDQMEDVCFTSQAHPLLVTQHKETQVYSLWILSKQKKVLSPTAAAEASTNTSWLGDTTLPLSTSAVATPAARSFNEKSSFLNTSRRSEFLHDVDRSSINHSFATSFSGFQSSTEPDAEQHPILSELKMERVWSSSSTYDPSLAPCSMIEEDCRREFGDIFFLTNSTKQLFLCINDTDSKELLVQTLDVSKECDEIPFSVNVGETSRFPSKRAIPINSSSRILDTKTPYGPSRSRLQVDSSLTQLPMDMLLLDLDGNICMYRNFVKVCEWKLDCASSSVNQALPTEFGSTLSPVLPAEGAHLTPSNNYRIQTPTSDGGISLSPCDQFSSVTPEHVSNFKTPARKRTRLQSSSNHHHSIQTIRYAYDSCFDIDIGSGCSIRCSASLMPQTKLMQDIMSAFDAVLPLSLVSRIKIDLLQVVGLLMKDASKEKNDIDIEWQAFIILLSHYLEVGSPVLNPANMDCTDWECLMHSEYHDNFGVQFPRLESALSLNESPKPPKSSFDKALISLPFLVAPEEFQEKFSFVFEAMHLMYEDYKLCVTSLKTLRKLSGLLSSLALELVQEKLSQDYVEHYSRDFGTVASAYDFKSDARKPLKYSPFPNRIPVLPPRIMEHLTSIMSGAKVQDFPLLSASQDNNGGGNVVQKGTVGYRTYLMCKFYLILFTERTAKSHEYLLIESMVKEGFKLIDLEEYPFGIALPLRHAIILCRSKPSTSFPMDAYALIGREDLRELKEAQASPHYKMHANHENDDSDSESTEISDSIAKGVEKAKSTDDADGLQHVQQTSSKRFGADRRLREVSRLLRSSAPFPLKVEHRPEISDQDLVSEQQSTLLSLCRRSLALPIGRGMLTLGTLRSHLTDVLPIPELCLSGCIPPSNAAVNLDTSNCQLDFTDWPSFHNGAASGLRLAPNMTKITRTWIVYNKPEEPSFAHAGMLLTLGLRGYLSVLAMTDVFDYLSQSHNATTVGLLLGMAATKRGTGDRAVSKMLCLHIPSLLPPPFAEIEVAPISQTAALIGIGLLYQGTGHRLMTEFLLAEIGRRPTTDRFDNRESYNLSAGLALGMIALGYGSKGTASGLTDLNIEDRLHKYMVGGKDPDFVADSASSAKCSRLLEGSSVNIEVTSAGATLALGLMFIKSGSIAVANRLAVPDTLFLLDYVRPDLLLLRVLARNLVLWDKILPSQDWITSQIPPVLLKYYAMDSASTNDTDKSWAKSIDTETISQAYSNIVAGAALSIGLRYSSTASKSAYDTLSHWLKVFMHYREQSGKLVCSNRSILCPDRFTAENCIGVLCLSLGLVMAGRGDLDTLRLLRGIHQKLDTDISYGHHMAVGMSIGLLFLGGGNVALKHTNDAVAALILSLYPHFSKASTDNMYHMQALRHMYVLATEPRYVKAIDVETQKSCFIPLEITTVDEEVFQYVAPCALPEFSSIKKLRVASPRYLNIELDSTNSLEFLQAIKQTGKIFVKRKHGHLSYAQDPKGNRSLLAQVFPKGSSTGQSMASFLSSFTEDPNILTFWEYFSSDSFDEPGGKDFAKFCASVLYECLTDEKPEMLTTYLALYSCISELRYTSSTLAMANIRFLLQYRACFPKDVESLLNLNFLSSVDERLQNHFGHQKIEGGNGTEKTYFEALLSQEENQRSVPLEYASFLSFYSMPLPSQMELVRSSALSFKVSHLAEVEKLLVNIPKCTLVAITLSQEDNIIFQ